MTAALNLSVFKVPPNMVRRNFACCTGHELSIAGLHRKFQAVVPFIVIISQKQKILCEFWFFCETLIDDSHTVFLKFATASKKALALNVISSTLILF